MQSLSRLLSIEASVITGRSIFRALPRSRHVDASFSTSRRAVRRAAHASKQNNANEPTSGAAATDAPPPIPTSAIGQVMAAQANFVRVKIDHLEGSDAAPPQPRLLCVVRALLKKMKREVLVGDRVRLVGIDWTDGRGMVDDVLPRHTRLNEPPVANVNHVLLVFSSAMPPLQPSAATRYLVAAEAAGLPITVVMNKADLEEEGKKEDEDENSPEATLSERDRVASWGYKTIAVSVVDQRGLEELEETLRGKVTVVAGPSGAGKSSIINALRLRAAGMSGTLEKMSARPSGWITAPSHHHHHHGEEAFEEESHSLSAGEGDLKTTRRDDEESIREVEDIYEENFKPAGAVQVAGVELQAVGSISERIGRGKHTTRNVMLVEMGRGGLLVDTPGFNQPSVVLPPSELAQYFPEIRAALEHQRCTFSNCQHLSEPGCVVRGADWERYPLYSILHAELQAIDEETSKRAVVKRQREGTVRMKSRGGGRMGEEAKLETKTHRRESRRSVRQQLSELVGDIDDDGDDVANGSNGSLLSP